MAIDSTAVAPVDALESLMIAWKFMADVSVFD